MSSSVVRPLVAALRDVVHPARRLGYPRATPLYEQTRPVLAVRYTAPLLFLTALAASLATDLVWTYAHRDLSVAPRPVTNASPISTDDPDTPSSDGSRPPKTPRILILAVHLAAGTLTAAYLVRVRRVYVHKLWVLPARPPPALSKRKRRSLSKVDTARSSSSSSRAPQVDIVLKTHSWFAPRFIATRYPHPETTKHTRASTSTVVSIDEGVDVTTSGNDVVLRIKERQFILRARGALVQGHLGLGSTRETRDMLVGVIRRELGS